MTRQRKLLIFGAGGFAEIAHYYFTHDTAYTVSAFVVDGSYLTESTFHDLPVLAWEEVENQFGVDDHDIFVALGLDRLNQTRADRVAACEQRGYRVTSFMSSRADAPLDLPLLPNTMIMERAGVHPYVSLGRNTIVWGGSRIGFRSQIGENCWIVAATLGEQCQVGDNTFIGLNATIVPGTRLGARNLIGAGALIQEDTPDDAVYRGHASERSRVPSHRLRLR